MKMTKTQKRNACKTIKSRATALFTSNSISPNFGQVMSMKDYDAIIKIVDKIMKKL